MFRHEQKQGSHVEKERNTFQYPGRGICEFMTSLADDFQNCDYVYTQNQIGLSSQFSFR